MKTRRPTRPLVLLAALALVVSTMGFTTGCAMTPSQTLPDTGGSVFEAPEERTTFKGISFVLPEDWEADASGDTMELETPDDDIVSQMTLKHLEVDLPSSTEDEIADYYLDGMLEAIDEQDGVTGADHTRIVTRTVNGHTVKSTMCTMKVAGHGLDLYIVVAGVDDGITTMMLGSMNGAYDLEIERIIDSIEVL